MLRDWLEGAIGTTCNVPLVARLELALVARTPCS
jgi:hypothetical protein